MGKHISLPEDKSGRRGASPATPIQRYGFGSAAAAFLSGRGQEPRAIRGDQSARLAAQVLAADGTPDPESDLDPTERLDRSARGTVPRTSLRYASMGV